MSWDTASPAPTDYRVDWAKSTEGYHGRSMRDMSIQRKLPHRYHHGPCTRHSRSAACSLLQRRTRRQIGVARGPRNPYRLRVNAHGGVHPRLHPMPGLRDEVNSTDDGSIGTSGQAVPHSNTQQPRADPLGQSAPTSPSAGTTNYMQAADGKQARLWQGLPQWDLVEWIRDVGFRRRDKRCRQHRGPGRS